MSAAVVSWCRHCGRPGPLTDEHVPPRSTNNEDPVGRLADPLDLNFVVQQVAAWDEGHVVSTLDERCNNRASDWGYVKEYRRWFELFFDGARRIAAKTNTDPLRGARPFDIELPHDVQPARFVRQVVGMFLAVQESEHLFVTYQALPDLIGPDPAGDSKRRFDGIEIAPLKLCLSVCNATWSYGTHPLHSIETDLGVRSDFLWTPPPSTGSVVDDFWTLCVAPFVFVLTTKDANDFGHDISHWAQWSVDQRPTKSERRFSLPTADQLQAGLRAMIYPGDYVVP
jgi:hypothetical protein